MAVAERNCLELSRKEVEALIIKELQKRWSGYKPLPISIDFEPKTEAGFCHCWWVASERKD